MRNGIPAILIMLCLLEACAKSHITVPFKKIPIENDTITQYFPPDSVLTNGFMQFGLLCIDNKNNKWIYNEGDGILRFDGKNWTRFNSYNTPVDFIHCQINYMLSDNNGIIYALGQGSRMAVYKNDTWSFYKLPFWTEEIQKDPVTNSIYFPFNSNSQAGMYKYNGGDYSDSSGYTFISSVNGKNAFGNSTVYNNKFYAAANGGIGNPADSNTIGILVQDENGTGGYFKFPGWVNTGSISKGFVDMVTSNGQDLVMCDNINYPGQMGTGTDADLFYFDGAKWTIVPITNGNGISIRPQFLTYAKDGSLWFANNLFQSFRLVKYANNTFTYYNLTVDNNFNQQGIGNLAIDENNIKWLTAYGSGLLAFKLQ